ncbi:MAG: HlyC/CorC family transporter, partial [Acidobacteria bacterium]|nr:HlyC/CorC family transporter [Acidobacteriota bacterium]
MVPLLGSDQEESNRCEAHVTIKTMEDFPYSLRLILLPLLLGVNGFFAAAEVALVSVRRTRMGQLAEAGDQRARAVLALLARPDRLLAATQLGVTVASLGLGWVGQETVYGLLAPLMAPVSRPGWDRLLHLAAFGIAFGLVTFLHMVVGEVVPKNMALERTERLALAVGPTLQFFARSTGFFVRVVEYASRGLSRFLGLHGTPALSAHSVGELKLIVSASRRLGGWPESQEDMLHHVMDFYDLTVRQVMVPRNEMVSLPAGSSLDEVIRTMVARRHSRLPVHDGSPENIIGILHARDLWPLWQRQRRMARAGQPTPEF